MKNRLAILVIGLLGANVILLPPTNAQTEGKFYCGQAYDLIAKTQVPATLMSSPHRAKPITVILWKSDFFGKEFSPKQRCETVSPKFQAAYTNGNFEYFKVGYDRNLPIVCAVKTQNERCTKTGMLFTLKPFGNTQSQLNALMGNIEGGEAGPDIYQSSDNRSQGEGIVNIREFLNSAK
jgi:Circadian oscillating protein COP23